MPSGGLQKVKLGSDIATILRQYHHCVVTVLHRADVLGLPDDSFRDCIRPRDIDALPTFSSRPRKAI